VKLLVKFAKTRNLSIKGATMRKTTLFAAALLLVSAVPVLSQTTTLYDGTSNVTPDSSPWGWTFAGIGTVTPPGGTGATKLDTTANDLFQAGYATIAPGGLYRTLGYNVRFDIKVVSENHSNPSADKNADSLADRSGVSVIVLGNDKKGVELAFWQTNVWTQSDTFLHSLSEDATFNTTAAGTGIAGLISYNLVVGGNSYSLFANGGVSPILTGSLHDYSASPNPYQTPNFLFVGDDTTSARGSFQFSRFDVTSAPEPGSLAFLATGFLGTAVFAFRKKLR
jgi:hypothetical protein